MILAARVCNRYPPTLKFSKPMDGQEIKILDNKMSKEIRKLD
jgi:hypothetical protein